MPLSPLAPLKLSNPMFDGTKSGHKHKSSSSRRSNRDHQGKKDGFEFDYEKRKVEKSTKEGPLDHRHRDVSRGDIKKVQDLASLLLDTRKSLQADSNVVDPSYNEHAEFDMDHHTDLKISRQTYTKAERVKSMITIKYLYMQRISESSYKDTVHKDVEGVYNPLQILRNRLIAQKDKEDIPKTLTMKLLPLACNVFSRHNNFSSGDWKMLWSIDLNEYFADISWRRNNWHKLRDPNGQLWFPPHHEDSSSISSYNSSLAENRKRLHDKLFSESEEEDEEEDEEEEEEEEEEEDDEDIKDSDSNLLSVKKKSIKEKMKGKLRSSYASSSLSGFIASSNVSTNGSGIFAASPLHEELKEQSFKLTPDEDKLSSPPHIMLNNKEFDLNDVIFNPIDPRPTLDEKAPEIDVEVEELNSENECVEAIADRAVCDDLMSKEMKNLFYQYNYFESLIQMRMKYVITIYPHFAKTLEAKLNHIIQKQLTELFQVIISVNDHNLPEYQQLYEGFLSEIQSVIHVVNDDYSIKIDNLLSNSDRSNGEINTSLTHELRKVNEKLDKLNVSLFSNSYGLASSSDEDTSDGIAMKMKDGEVSKIIYFFLENVIVVLLRVIWIVVNIYKLFAFLVMLIWRLVRFIVA